MPRAKAEGGIRCLRPWAVALRPGIHARAYPERRRLKPASTITRPTAHSSGRGVAPPGLGLGPSRGVFPNLARGYSLSPGVTP
jgi:hypothetical protein